VEKGEKRREKEAYPKKKIPNTPCRYPVPREKKRLCGKEPQVLVAKE
jgi:hypothetical protein